MGLTLTAAPQLVECSRLTRRHDHRLLSCASGAWNLPFQGCHARLLHWSRTATWISRRRHCQLL